MEGQDKKSKILRATLALITENGFHGTPVSMIAHVAGVGAGTIYRYFVNKEALVNELYDAVQLDLHEATLRDLPEGVPAREEFRLKWLNVVRYFVTHPIEARFLEQYMASPYLRPQVVAETNRRNAHLQVLRTRGIASGEMRDVSYQTLAVFLWGTVQQIHRLDESGVRKADPAFLEEIFSVFWEGLKPSEGR